MGRRSLMSGGRRKQQLVDKKQQLLFALTLFLYAIMATILFLWVTLLPDSSLVENPVVFQATGFSFGVLTHKRPLCKL